MTGKAVGLGLATGGLRAAALCGRLRVAILHVLFSRPVDVKLGPVYARLRVGIW